ncbi:MAG: NAD(P)-binding domain-containing protein [Opitutaceae bacterium]
MAFTSRNVAVIGAGAAGLSAARYLMEDGHEVTVFELGSRIGGLWVYDNDNGLSAAYESLHINSEPRVTHYRGFPFPDDTSLFPSHREVTGYLEAFADKFHIRKRIQFNTKVTSVAPVTGASGSGWLVQLGHGAQEQFDSVVVATGHQGVPAHPDFASQFTGTYVHSHSYREPEVFRGQRVLVVGVGNSGLDIAADICTVASETFVAARSPVLIMPKMIFGAPSARFMGKFNKTYVPWWVQRQIMRTVNKIFHGRMEQWGLRTPKGRTHPASNATFMAHVSYGKISIRPGVEEIVGRHVLFTDGREVDVDTLIAATGYEIDLPFLPDGVSPITGRRMGVYKRVVHPDWADLYFVGFFNVSGGANISMMDVQSEWVAALVSGDVSAPPKEDMYADMRREQAVMASRYPGTARYGLELDPNKYRRAVARELRNRTKR